jgi:hypothetical protein
MKEYNLKVFRFNGRFSLLSLYVLLLRIFRWCCLYCCCTSLMCQWKKEIRSTTYNTLWVECIFNCFVRQLLAWCKRERNERRAALLL